MEAISSEWNFSLFFFFLQFNRQEIMRNNIICALQFRTKNTQSLRAPLSTIIIIIIIILIVIIITILMIIVIIISVVVVE